MSKPIKPLQQQIDEYKFKFEAFTQLTQWLNNNPKPAYTCELSSNGEYVTNLEFQRWEYNHQNLIDDLYKKGYSSEQWNWSDKWDGQLIKDVIALEQAGFTIVSFSRKRKVTLKAPIDMNYIQLWTDSNLPVDKRTAIVDRIIDAVDDSWYSISFKPTLSIYWKGRSSSWNY